METNKLSNEILGYDVSIGLDGKVFVNQVNNNGTQTKVAEALSMIEAQLIANDFNNNLVTGMVN